MIKAVRGAVSLDFDNEKDLQEKVGSLFDLLMKKNGIYEKDFVSIIFSQTKDISYNPAKALRLARGFSSVPLFCTQEPECVDFTEKMMLRVLVTFNGNENPAVPVYLGKAETLRSDINFSEKSQS